MLRHQIEESFIWEFIAGSAPPRIRDVAIFWKLPGVLWVEGAADCSVPTRHSLWNLAMINDRSTTHSFKQQTFPREKIFYIRNEGTNVSERVFLYLPFKITLSLLPALKPILYNTSFWQFFTFLSFSYLSSPNYSLVLYRCIIFIY